MKLAVRSILGILAIGMWAQMSLANNNATTTSALSVQQPKKEGSIWSGFININRSTSLIDHEDGTRQDSADYLARINAKLNSDYTLRIQGGYSQDLKYPEANDFADTALSLVRAPVKWGSLGRYVLTGYRISATAPTSKDSYKRQSLQTALSSAFVWGVNPDRIIPGLEVNGSISLGRNFHQYETALDGRVNNQYSSAQALSVGYGFKYGLSLSFDFAHKNTYSYQNNVRDSFEFSQELGLQLNRTFSVALGHTNSGSSLRPNGNDSNVEIINENTSLVYGSLTALF